VSKVLTKMLDESNALVDYPLPQKTILMALANRFQSHTEYLFYDPQELYENSEMGTIQDWTTLLNLQETKNYIKGQMAFISQISQRKTFMGLVSQALSGNAQAAKQVQELSGILNQQDTNRVVVLHQIPRKKQEEVQ
jgi:hypothetical protein